MFDTKDKRAKRNVKIYKRNHESDKEKVWQGYNSCMIQKIVL
jgi:hypothetical protein